MNAITKALIADMTIDVKSESTLSLATQIVSAFVQNNSIAVVDLPGLIKSTYSSLRSLAQGGPDTGETPKPAVSIKRSVTDDYLICLEDGKKLKMLKRYLRSRYKLSPDEYRAKWGLPLDYPMVAPNYAEQRSQFAKKIGLGRTAGRTKQRRKAG